VGSGLILLAIVGAWLAVLVPMALRRYDTGQRSAERFHDAMRVLSRRHDPATQERAAARVDAELAELPVGRLTAARERWAAREPLTPAARRRRLLLALVLVALGTLAGALLGPAWLLAPHLITDLLLVAFVVHLRKTAAARAERERRAARARRRAAAAAAAQQPVVEQEVAPEPVLRVPAHVAGIPDRMPPRPEPLPAPAARYDELPAARGAVGEAWSPVPVPAPTYLSAPVAPRRVVDLTTPGAYSDGVADAERELGIVDEGPELDEILERRRAVNDW
jgi:hypothetical protein